MVYVLVKIEETEQTNNIIGDFNYNIFNNQVSNIVFKDDSFIRFVNPDTILVYLNTVIPKEIPFYLTIMSIIIGFVFRINFFIGFGTILAILYFLSKDIIFLLFKLGIRKKGYKGSIEAL